MKTLVNRLHTGVGGNLMHHNTRIYSRHLFVRLGKKITKFVKEASVHLEFIGRSDSDMDVLDDSQFHENINRHHLGDVTQVTSNEHFVSQDRHLKWRRRNLRHKILKTVRHCPEARHKQGMMMPIAPW